MKNYELEQHNEDCHPVRVVKQCEFCQASYFEKEKMTHSCISYVLALLKQVVGESAFDMAVKKLNFKFELGMEDGKPRSQHSKEACSGTLESLLTSQLEIFEKSMHTHLEGFLDRTKRVEESFLDRLNLAGRHHLANAEITDRAGRKSLLPQTINLPDLPLVRVQDRRNF